MMINAPVPPKFGQGAEVYYRNYHDFANGDRQWMNRVFFKVGYVRWDQKKETFIYRLFDGCYIEEERLRPGDVLSLMVDEDYLEG